MIDATAIIMTKNEEKNIVNCLQSMKNFAKRCVVIDCGSDDKTVELAIENGADIYFHEFEYYAKQFNWGINNTDIDTEWIIRLDADEVFPSVLCNEIGKIIDENKEKEMNGIIIEADLVFMGKCLKYGMPNKRKMMLFKKEFGTIEDKRRDAHSVISKGFSVSCKNHFVHNDFKNLDSFIKRYNWYATREMQDYIDYINKKDNQHHTDENISNTIKKKYGIYYKMPMYLRAWMLFVYCYFFKLGFLDGKEGFVYNFLDCYWYRILVDAKINEYYKTGKKFEKLKAID